jgi:hypothetical protein
MNEDKHFDSDENKIHPLEEANESEEDDNGGGQHQSNR